MDGVPDSPAEGERKSDSAAADVGQTLSLNFWCRWRLDGPTLVAQALSPNFTKFPWSPPQAETFSMVCAWLSKFELLGPQATVPPMTVAIVAQGGARKPRRGNQRVARL